MQTEILYGVHPVAEALAAGRRKILEVFLARGRSGEPAQHILDRAQALRVPIRVMDAPFWDSLDPGHQSVAARVGPYPLASLEDILDIAIAKGTPPLVLVLDQIEDPRNCGALIRSALCAGASGVVMPDRRSAPLGPAVSKASAGALEHAAVARVANLVRSLGSMKEAGLWVYGTDAGAQTSLWEADLTGPAALCVGGEGRGLRRLSREACDVLVSVPVLGPVDSLNASVAGALALYEAIRQRREKQKT